MMLLGWAVTAWAGASGQRAFDLEKGASTWSFHYGWADATGKHQLDFELPARALVEDREEITWFPRHQMMEDVAKDVRRFGRDLDHVDLKVKVDGPTLSMNASGTGDVRGALREAEGVRDAAIETWLAEHRFWFIDDGVVSFDHAALVTDYASQLRPVSDALWQQAPDERAFVSLALSFVQTIPYEARKRKGGDPGYRRPLALLSRNRGDCDSKSVLFLALVHGRLPDLPLAVVYVPEHALVGIGLDGERGDRTFRDDGVRYIYAEPVGPALHPLGETAPEDRKAAKKGVVRAVP
ncbi:MAG: hypothetical protein KC621_13980 [Myxococcales bacterium]|nr:hypothetical protein [Myxococcales bacterium]